MTQKTKERKENKTPEVQSSGDDCSHFWDIEAANGPQSRGVCKICGKSRIFYNAFPNFNPLRKKGNSLEIKGLHDAGADKDDDDDDDGDDNDDDES